MFCPDGKGWAKPSAEWCERGATLIQAIAESRPSLNRIGNEHKQRVGTSPALKPAQALRKHLPEVIAAYRSMNSARGGRLDAQVQDLVALQNALEAVMAPADGKPGLIAPAELPAELHWHQAALQIATFAREAWACTFEPQGGLSRDSPVVVFTVAALDQVYGETAEVSLEAVHSLLKRHWKKAEKES